MYTGLRSIHVLIAQCIPEMSLVAFNLYWMSKKDDLS